MLSTSSIQCEWPKIFYYRLKSIGFGIVFFASDLIVTTDGKKPFYFSSERTDHVVIQIPRLHTQCFANIKPIPCVRGFEMREIEKTFINNSKGISHLAFVFLRNFDGYLLTRF